MRWLCLAAALLTPVSVSAAPIDLICNGTAIKTESRSANVTLEDDDGGEADGKISSYAKVRSQERLRIHVDDAGASAIKLPPNLIPPLHASMKEGWLPLADLVVTEDRIWATYRLNALNKAKLAIDRHTGDIDSSAFVMKFSGTCEKAPDATERKF